MTIVKYREKPDAVQTNKFLKNVKFTFVRNLIELEVKEEKESKSPFGLLKLPPYTWQGETRSFWLPEGELEPDVVAEYPEKYFWYDKHKEYKAQAQKLLDDLRNGCPIVPVPSFKEGAAVCNRAADQTKLLAGLSMGGIEYYELASGEIVNLSLEDIKAIAKDIAAAEMTWQRAKQECWAAITAANYEEEMREAVSNLEETLKAYT